VPLNLDFVRAQFPALSVTDSGVRRIYLDNPAGTQVPTAVVQRMSDCLLDANANIGGFFEHQISRQLSSTTRAPQAQIF
jgi:selenocysteine lyase/cysteine desulfurase